MDLRDYGLLFYFCWCLFTTLILHLEKKKCLSGRQRPFSEDCLYFCFLFDSIFITFLFWIDRWAGVTGTESVAGGLYMAHGTTQGVTVLAGFSDSSCFHFASSSSFSVTARVWYDVVQIFLYILALPHRDLHISVRRFSIWGYSLRATVELSILMKIAEG